MGTMTSGNLSSCPTWGRDPKSKTHPQQTFFYQKSFNPPILGFHIDVNAAMLVFLNTETVATLVSPPNPLGIELC